MKYFAFCLFLLAILTGGCIFSACQVTAVVTETEQFLHQAWDSFVDEDITQCEASIQIASAHWKKHDNTLELLIHQDELDHVCEELAGLEASILAGDRDDFQNSCARLISNLQNLRKMQWPYVLHTR